MKTADEIVARIAELEKSSDDFFGFQRTDLIGFLPFAAAKPFLKDGVTDEQWTPKPITEEAVRAEMLGYMPFAWDKANGCRGLSADRSVQHMKAWLWLLGDDLGARLDDIYEFYGKPCLRAICEKYGWDWRQWDNGEWRNSENGPAIPPPETVFA